MAIDNLTSLTPNKQNYPDIIPPSDPTYYFSAEEYNKLLRTLQILIDDYNLKVSMIGQPTNLPILPTTDSLTQPTDINLFSAARTLQEIRSVLADYENYYLSKVVDDTAQGTIRFNKGIKLGDFQTGFRGGKIDQNADAELKSLKLREWLEVPELRYNRIEVQMGDKWRSPGGGIVESVDIENRIITLKLEPGEYGAVAQNDLCMGIFHSMDSSNNSATSSDDSKNNRTIKGFATAYFKVEQLLNPQENNSRFRYSLRPISPTHNKQVHPEAFMNFAAFGNTTNADRMTSMYETRTYQRFLIGMNNWEISQANVAAQFGDLSNLTSLGLSGLTNYSIYLNNVYFTGTIQQMKAPKIELGTWWTWKGTEWFNTGVPSTGVPKNGIHYTLANQSLAVLDTDTTYENTWTELHIYEGDVELDFTTSTLANGTYSVTMEATGVVAGTKYPVEETVTFMKTTPIVSLLSNVTFGTIVFTITGKRINGDSFSFKTNQSFTKVYSGEDGAPGAIGPAVIYRGNYSSESTYYGASTRTDVVKFSDGVYYRTKETAGVVINTPPKIGGVLTDKWYEFGASFDSVATSLLLAEKANIGGFAYDGNTSMISQTGFDSTDPTKTTINLGNYNGSLANFVPNLKLDGSSGDIFLRDQIALRGDGSGFLAGGNISWDELGNTIFKGTVESNASNNRIKIDALSRSVTLINESDQVVANWVFNTVNGFTTSNINLYFKNASDVTTNIATYSSQGVMLLGENASNSIGIFQKTRNSEEVIFNMRTGDSSKEFYAAITSTSLLMVMKGLMQSSSTPPLPSGTVYRDSNNFIKVVP